MDKFGGHIVSFGGQALSTHLHLQHDLTAAAKSSANKASGRRLAPRSGNLRRGSTGDHWSTGSPGCIPSLQHRNGRVSASQFSWKKVESRSSWQKSGRNPPMCWLAHGLIVFAFGLENLKLSLAEITGISRRVVVSIVRPSVPLRNLREYPFPLK